MKNFIILKLRSGYTDLGPEDDERLNFSGVSVIEKIPHEEIIAFVAKKKLYTYSHKKEDYMWDVLRLKFDMKDVNYKIIMAYYECCLRESEDKVRDFKVAVAKEILKGKWVIKETSFLPEYKNGKYKYAWKRYGRRTYAWVMPACDCLTEDFGRRIEWTAPKFYDSRRDALNAMYGDK